MSFKTWCNKNEKRFLNSPEGDLIEDMRRDKKKFPATKYKKPMKRHLIFSGACYEALIAFDSLYEIYKKETI